MTKKIKIEKSFVTYTNDFPPLHPGHVQVTREGIPQGPGVTSDLQDIKELEGKIAELKRDLYLRQNEISRISEFNTSLSIIAGRNPSTTRSTVMNGSGPLKPGTAKDARHSGWKLAKGKGSSGSTKHSKKSWKQKKIKINIFDFISAPGIAKPARRKKRYSSSPFPSSSSSPVPVCDKDTKTRFGSHGKPGSPRSDRNGQGLSRDNQGQSHDNRGQCRDKRGRGRDNCSLGMPVGSKDTKTRLGKSGNPRPRSDINGDGQGQSLVNKGQRSDKRGRGKDIRGHGDDNRGHGDNGRNADFKGLNSRRILRVFQ